MKQYKVIKAFGSLKVGDVINENQLTGDKDISNRVNGGFIELVETESEDEVEADKPKVESETESNPE